MQTRLRVGFRPRFVEPDDIARPSKPTYLRLLRKPPLGEGAFALQGDVGVQTERYPVGYERGPFDGDVFGMETESEVPNQMKVECHAGVAGKAPRRRNRTLGGVSPVAIATRVRIEAA
jgi:hypothetical protein